MDEDMLDCIRALAENRIQDAKDKAIICCINDTTKKNASKTSYYKKLLENGSTKMFELPLNLKGLLNVQDVSDFNEARYYLGKEQQKTYEQIVEGVNWELVKDKLKNMENCKKTLYFCYNETFISFWEIMNNLTGSIEDVCEVVSKL